MRGLNGIEWNGKDAWAYRERRQLKFDLKSNKILAVTRSELNKHDTALQVTFYWLFSMYYTWLGSWSKERHKNIPKLQEKLFL